jgi:hypothetical protein
MRLQSYVKTSILFETRPCFAIAATHRKSASPLVELGEVACLVACDRAAAMIGTVASLSGGEIVDWLTY